MRPQIPHVVLVPSYKQRRVRLKESGDRIIQNACWGIEKSDAAVITDFGVGIGVGVGGGGRHWLTITSDSPLGAAGTYCLVIVRVSRHAPRGQPKVNSCLGETATTTKKNPVVSHQCDVGFLREILSVLSV